MFTPADKDRQAEGAPFLRVKRSVILDTLRQIQNIGQPRKTEQIVLSFDGKCLHFDLSGMSVAIPAEGQWNCQVRAKAAFIQPLIKVPLPDDPWLIHVENGNLYFGPSFSCPCEVQGEWKSIIQLPLNYDDATLLCLKLKYTHEEIEQSGLRDSVAKAEAACMEHVNEACAALAMYNVKKEDLRALVDKWLRETGLLNTVK